MKIFTTLLFIMTLMACNKSKDLTETNNAIPPEALDKLIVHLKEGTDIKSLENEFEKYKLKMKSYASRTQNSYLFTFDSDAISSEKLIKKLNKKDEIVDANNIVEKFMPARSSDSGSKKRVKVSDQ